MRVSVVWFAKTWIAFNVSGAHSLCKTVHELKFHLLLSDQHRGTEGRILRVKYPFYTKPWRAKDKPSDHSSHKCKDWTQPWSHLKLLKYRFQALQLLNLLNVDYTVWIIQQSQLKFDLSLSYLEKISFSSIQEYLNYSKYFKRTFGTCHPSSIANSCCHL